MYDILQLNDMTLSDLQDIAKKLKIEKISSLAKQDLIYKILDHQALQPEPLAAPVKKTVTRKRKPKEDVAEETNESETKSVAAVVEEIKEEPVKAPAVEIPAPAAEPESNTDADGRPKRKRISVSIEEEPMPVKKEMPTEPSPAFKPKFDRPDKFEKTDKFERPAKFDRPENLTDLKNLKEMTNSNAQKNTKGLKNLNATTKKNYCLHLNQLQTISL